MVRERAVLQIERCHYRKVENLAATRRSKQALNEIWMRGADALWVPPIPLRGIASSVPPL